MQRSSWMAVLALALVLHAGRANAADLVCDAGAVCPDEDQDGFAACGCPWSGTPCDCDDRDPTSFPGAPERCNSTVDNDCSRVAGDRCGAREGCLDGLCVPRCIPLDDFGCDPGSYFFTTDAGCLCRPFDCTTFGCGPGFTCDDAKTCVPSCGPDVRCPAGQICRGDGCVDPCAEVTCPEGAVCSNGRCLPSCGCDPGAACPAGRTCDRDRCIESACVGVACTSGTHCAGGACVDDCEGVVCPPKRVCTKRPDGGGATCADLCNPSPCALGLDCQWRTGECTSSPVPEGSLVSPTAPREPLDVGGAGWVCSSGGLASASMFTAIGSVSAVALFALRRRRRRRR